VPCYRCDTRQTDPAKGASPWKRGVVAGEQVLVCPECQRAHDWTADLDRCSACGSTQLAKTLGTVVCKACGAATEGNPARATPATGLAAEVEEAIARVLREPPRA
jgi:hypothetical protein